MKSHSNSSQNAENQHNGKFVGPRVPTIGFWYGRTYLGEERYPCGSDKSNWEHFALTKLAQTLRFFGLYNELQMLYSTSCTSKVYY